MWVTNAGCIPEGWLRSLREFRPRSHCGGTPLNKGKSSSLLLPIFSWVSNVLDTKEKLGCESEDVIHQPRGFPGARLPRQCGGLNRSRNELNSSHPPLRFIYSYSIYGSTRLLFGVDAGIISRSMWRPYIVNIIRRHFGAKQIVLLCDLNVLVPSVIQSTQWRYVVAAVGGPILEGEADPEDRISEMRLEFGKPNRATGYYSKFSVCGSLGCKQTMWAHLPSNWNRKD